MRTTLSTLVALASTAQLASAGWYDAQPFTCPSNTNNYCNSYQSSGFDWSSLSYGSFSEYGDFEFTGFSCASSFGSLKKRDTLTGRDFQDKCITGVSSSDSSSCPSFGCGSSSSVSAFSVTEFQISVEFNCELEFHYTMPDSSLCKQTSSCSKGGSIVKNTQCGGAKNVTIVYPSPPSGGGKSSCSIGIHSMSFDCSTHSSTVTHSTTAVSQTKPTTTPTTPASSATTTSVPVSSTSSSRTTSTSTTAIGTLSSNGTTPATSPTTTPATSPTTSLATSPATSSTSTSTAPAETVVTVVTVETTTVCPVTTTHTTGGTTSIETGVTTSTITITSTSTVCTRCEEKTTSTSATSPILTSTSTTTSTSPVTTPSCPDVLPQCLNTWLFIEGCSSNTDTACFCPSSDFATNVYACLSAHGASNEEISAAQTYFQGICAPYIPGNPGLVTCASSLSVSVSQSITVPVTTVEVFTTIVVPCTETTGISSGFTIPSSSSTTVISTAVTVPQVVFSTITGSSTVSAALVVGTATTAAGATIVAPKTTTAAKTTLAVSATSNGTTTASAKPSTSPFTGAASQNSMAFGTFGFALFFAVLAL